MEKFGIIGAGPSGLTAGLFLSEDFRIYESAHEAGGHARSIRDGQWTFDRGPHILFSRDKKILDWMLNSLRGNVHNSRRNVKVLINGRLVGYPIENDLSSLSKEDNFNALLNLVESRIFNSVTPNNLDEWFRKNFGEHLTEIYFKPYNEKVWNIPLSDLSMSWADRIPQPPLRDVISGAVGIHREGYVHQLHYQYPLHGGFQALTDQWASKIKEKIQLNCKVNKIESSSGNVRLSTSLGDFLHEKVIFTGYLQKLPSICDFKIPEFISEDINSLRVNPMSCVTLGFRGVDVNQFTALYIPDQDSPFNRISFPHIFSPFNSPAGHFLVQGDLTYSPGQPVLEESKIIELLHTYLNSNRIIGADSELVYRNHSYFPYAYVVNDIGSEIKVERIKDFFASKGIILHGRFGAFNYINTDMCVKASAELVSSLTGRSDPYELLREY